MTLQELYEMLKARYGARSDPDTWWPVYCHRTEPPEFERVITNVLVTQSRWPVVERAVAALDQQGLLTAKGLAEATEAAIAACAKPTGFQQRKAQALKELGQLVITHFGTEAQFCATVTPEQLAELTGFGPETIDRTLLYTCGKLAWPVDTYCLRMLTHHQVIAAAPAGAADKRATVQVIKRMVEQQMPRTLDDWRRLHAVLQLGGMEL